MPSTGSATGFGAWSAGLARTATGQVIPTADIERLHAPFRSALAHWCLLSRRGAPRPKVRT
jgi:hypothetical protein